MDSIGSNKLALEAFSLAFTIQRIFQSKLILPEAKDKLYRDYCKLKEHVALLTRIEEIREKVTLKKGGPHDNSPH
jgi:hypothetical protein